MEIIPGEAQGPGFVKMSSVHFVPRGTANLLTHRSGKEYGKYDSYAKNFKVFQMKSLLQAKLMLITERCFFFYVNKSSAFVSKMG